MKILLLIIFCLSANVLQARMLSGEQKIEDFRSLVAQIRAGYGPLDYKRETQGIDLDELVNEYEAKILSGSGNADFYYTLAEFIGRFRDGHFNPVIPTTHKSELPFTADLVQGKVLIDWVDRDKLSQADFPFEKGDEIIEFSGRAIADEIDLLSYFIQSGKDTTIRRKAVWALTLRRGSRMPVPTGALGRTVIKRAKSGRYIPVREGVLSWQESGEVLFEAKQRPAALVSKVNYGMLSARDSLQELLGAPRLEKTYACNPGTRIAIPEAATILMHPDRGGPFVAYYHPDPRFSGNVGYIRIPDYFPMDKLGNPAYAERFSQYEWVVEQLEQNTVGLVIDQDHNCGGSVDYLEQMLGLFMPINYAATNFELLATPESYFDFKKWLEEDSVPFSRRRVWQENVLKLIRDTYQSGASRLTVKTSITGRPFFEPNRVHYTKPIVMLIDEIAGSGGDAFPAMLGGFKRARLIGTATSGLGGHVMDMAPLPHSQMGGRLTKSLFYRPDGVAIENNGAVPLAEDRYLPTYNDFVDEYREYQAFYLERLLAMVRANEVFLP